MELEDRKLQVAAEEAVVLQVAPALNLQVDMPDRPLRVMAAAVAAAGMAVAVVRTRKAIVWPAAVAVRDMLAEPAYQMLIPCAVIRLSHPKRMTYIMQVELEWVV